MTSSRRNPGSSSADTHIFSALIHNAETFCITLNNAFARRARSLPNTLGNYWDEGNPVQSHNWSIDGDEFIVLCNAEGQHSLWPSAKEIPSGWKQIGPMGSKATCLDWIESNWDDLRPRSLIDGG